jgi:thiol-disulfide isomerase/thioredoxin
MKAKHLLFVCWLCCGVAAAFTACSQQAPKGYTVNGTADGTVDGDTVFLCDMQGLFAIMPLDTAIIKDGKFEFKGEIEGAAMRLLVPVHDGAPTCTQYFILENAAITAHLGVGDAPSNFECGPNGELFKEYMAGSDKLTEQMEEPYTTLGDSTADETAKKAAQQTIDSLQQLAKEYSRKFIIDHVPSAISDMLFAFNMQEFTEAEQAEILKLFGEKQPDYPNYKKIMAERKASESTAVGAQYTDIELPAPDGTMLRVSDFVAKNKFTLVDFWASWCGPCRAEMPTVVKAYTDYHKKGFEVVGVSLDNNKDAWVKAIDQLKMPWPQMSDLKGWECKGALDYNVRSIPANVLIDQQGNIIAKDLRGEDLLNKMAELLK